MIESIFNLSSTASINKLLKATTILLDLVSCLLLLSTMSSQSGFLDFVGQSEWNAWKALEGTGKEDAQRMYVEAAEEVSCSRHISETEC